MKRCPQCGTDYSDDTLRFCLEDGSQLADVVDEQATVVRRGDHDPHKTEKLPAEVTRAARDPLRVEIPTDRTTSASLPPATQTSGGGGLSPILKILLVVVILGVLVVLGAGILGIAFYIGTRRDTVDLKTPTPTPVPTFTPFDEDTPTPDDERTKLEKELANLKKQLEDAENGTTDDELDMGETRTVNSPGDGFLALRSWPSTEYGERIAKIPHGANIKIAYCLQQRTTVSGRSGKWCMVTYGGQTGWVFDAWLN